MTHVGPRNNVLDSGADPPRERASMNFLVHIAINCITVANSWLDTWAIQHHTLTTGSRCLKITLAGNSDAQLI